MQKDPKNLKTCKNGHQFYKSSDCPVCPVCEQNNKLTDGFLSKLPAPARRAVEAAGIKTLKQLAKYSEVQLLMLHGFGPSAIKILIPLLEKEGLSFFKPIKK